MRGPKRSDLQRENDYTQITGYYLKGWYQSDIAKELGLSQQQISIDIRTIQARWRNDTTINLDEAKQKELARLDELEREFWAAWESSKEERTRARQEMGYKKDTALDADGRKVKDDKPVVTRSSMEKEQRDGNPAFLNGVLSCIDRRCKLLGIDAPEKKEVDNTGEMTIRVIYDDTDIDNDASPT